MRIFPSDKDIDSKHSISLKRKLYIYLSILVCLIFSAILCLMLVLKVFPSSENEVNNGIDTYINSYYTVVNKYCTTLSAHGIDLSQTVSEQIENYLDSNHISFNDLNNNIELTGQLCQSVYNDLHSSLLRTKCSGAFILLNSTVNTGLQYSYKSRTCLYLKLVNINISEPVHPDVCLFRGSTDISKKNNIAVHNQWDLEYRTDTIEDFDKLILPDTYNNTDSKFYFTQASPVQGTWEKAIYLLVPISSPNGEIYGLCGFEINDMYYKLAHSLPASHLSKILGILAPKNDDSVYTNLGLVSGTTNGWLPDVNNMEITPFNDELSKYYSKDSTYIGRSKNININPKLNISDKTQWSVSVMISMYTYNKLSFYRHLIIMGFFVILFTLCMLFCFILGKRYINSIIDGMDKLKSHRSKKSRAYSGITEIDNLIKYFEKQDFKALEEKKSTDAILQSPPDNFSEFIDNIASLSPAEKTVFDLYIEGLRAQEIANKLCLSINTIKTHNRRIYSKLNVKSRKEMMVYIQYMKATAPPSNIQ